MSKKGWYTELVPRMPLLQKDVCCSDCSDDTADLITHGGLGPLRGETGSSKVRWGAWGCSPASLLSQVFTPISDSCVFIDKIS